jgi:hypothetical protein
MDIATDTKQASKPRKAKAQVQTEASEIQNVVNLPIPVKAFGQEWEIKKFSIGQIAQAMTYLGPLQYVVQELADKPQPLSSGQIASVVLAALSISGESIIGLLSVAISQPAEWIQAQDDELGALRLLTATVEKNTHFFSQENIAEYKELVGRLQQAIPALSGLTSTA